jgi:hypothetical protein
VAKKSQKSKKVEKRKRKGKVKIVTGTGLYLSPRALQDLDQRTAFTQALLSRRKKVVDSLGGEPTPLAEMLIDRIIFADVILGNFEIKTLAGYQPTERDWREYCTLRNSNSRHAALLGLQWLAPEMEDLASYLNKNYPVAEGKNETP